MGGGPKKPPPPPPVPDITDPAVEEAARSARDRARRRRGYLGTILNPGGGEGVRRFGD